MDLFLFTARISRLQGPRRIGVVHTVSASPRCRRTFPGDVEKRLSRGAKEATQSRLEGIPEDHTNILHEGESRNSEIHNPKPYLNHNLTLNPSPSRR